MTKRPSKKELSSYGGDKKKVAEYYDVSTRTALRWLHHYGLYKRQSQYGCNKLDKEKAKEIRELYKDGTVIKELANSYKVTFSTISRIIHNITYKEDEGTAIVQVIYNPR